MSAPSKIKKLPRVARELIDRALREENFSSYRELTERFKGFGKGFSKSSLHRYGQQLQEQTERAKFEAEVMEHLGDDAGFLLRWARTNPGRAARLVRRLKKEEQKGVQP